MLLTLSFDGTAYHGWQVQPNAVTVQQVLQESLLKLLGVKTSVTGCSRTDAGVHANEFCCHIDCDEKIPDSAFLRGLNSILPSDIAVTACKTVSDDFHARYSALGKTYVYHIYNSPLNNPFLARYSWQIDRPLDIELMNKFCQKIIGTKDFYAFSASGRTVTDTVRTIKECYVKKDNKDITLTVTANGFLYNMVRIITGTAVGVSDRKINIGDIENILYSKNRSAAGITAPPCGLFLDKVIY